MSDLLPQVVYGVELCSGERRRWRYIGEVDNGEVVWMDVDTGCEFNESSLMYAWSLIGRENEASPDRPLTADGK